MEKSHRTSTLIALGARRQALQLARDIAFPKMKTRATWTLPGGCDPRGQGLRGVPWWGREARRKEPMVPQSLSVMLALSGLAILIAMVIGAISAWTLMP